MVRVRPEGDSSETRHKTFCEKFPIDFGESETLTPFGPYNNIKGCGVCGLVPDTPSLYWGPAGLMGASFFFHPNGLGNLG